MNMPHGHGRAAAGLNSPSMTEMLQFDMGTMTATGDFLAQLGDFADFADGDVDVDDGASSNAAATAATATNGSATSAAAADAKNRNRGNYRCSKCGEPKKGHVCPLVPTNFKCSRCGLPKKTCTCSAPASRSIGVQVEMDADMTTRALDLSLQGVIEFHKSVAAYPSPPSGAS